MSLFLRKVDLADGRVMPLRSRMITWCIRTVTLRPPSAPVRIIKHEAVPGSGSFEVCWPDGRRYFYWDDLVGRRLRPDLLTRDQALEQARALAREKRDRTRKAGDA